jgi:two-component system, chemotaxis family, CheB/CheR fusion protein
MTHHFFAGGLVPLPLASLPAGWPASIAFLVLAALLGSLLISARKKSEVDRRVLEGQFKALFENGAVGIQFLDLEGRILRANQAELDLLGLSGQEVVGRPFAEFLAEPQAASELVTKVKEEGVLRGFAASLRTKNGALRRVLLDASLHPADGNEERIHVFLRDITDQERVEKGLLKQKEEAEEALRARDRFLAVLSHELRAPLTPVLIAASQQLEEDGQPAETRRLNELIRRNVELEARLIDNLLDLTMIGQGKLELDINTVNCHALIRNVVEICQSEINGKQLQLALELRAQNGHVRGDSGRLHQVFWNLIKNAIKFTPPGGRLAVRSENRHGVLRVMVTDTGIGIAPEELSRVFTVFHDRGPARAKFGGLGLGLAISQAIAHAHHGKLIAESNGPGQGSTFVLEIPALESPFADRPLSRLIAGPLTDSQSLRILLVEDHEDSARLIAQLLRKLNYQVTSAGTVHGALQAAESEQFDLLVSDIGLPDGNGLDLLGELRKKWPIQGIALSGFGMEEDMKMSHQAGFLEHLTKPVNFQKLELAIQRASTVPRE